VPFVRTEGSAKQDLLDGHGCVCHAPLTHVAVSPCTHPVSPAVKCHNQHCVQLQRYRARTTRTVARSTVLQVLKLAVENQRFFTVKEEGGIVNGYRTSRSQRSREDSKECEGKWCHRKEQGEILKLSTTWSFAGIGAPGSGRDRNM
jgi:hypothetical protein